MREDSTAKKQITAVNLFGKPKVILRMRAADDRALRLITTDPFGISLKSKSCVAI